DLLRRYGRSERPARCCYRSCRRGDRVRDRRYLLGSRQVSQMREEKAQMNERAKRSGRLASGLVVVALVVTSAIRVVGTATAPSVKAWATLPPCDFLTG